MEMFTRMTIAEANSYDDVGRLMELAGDHLNCIDADGLDSARLMCEPGKDGRLVIIEVTFTTREALAMYHKGPAYKQFAAAGAKFIAGDFVVKRLIGTSWINGGAACRRT